MSGGVCVGADGQCIFAGRFQSRKSANPICRVTMFLCKADLLASQEPELRM